MTEINIQEIQKLIPHRHPFLLVDKVVNYKKSESCVGIKNVTFNEDFFQGHFPNNPIMPGVLIIEAMAQTATILAAKSLNCSVESGLSVLFMGIENARFKKSVLPGDVLELHVKFINNKMNIWFVEGVAIVNNIKVAEAKFSALISNGK